MPNYIFDAKNAGRSPTRRHPVTGEIEKIPFTVPAADARGRRLRRTIVMCDAAGVVVHGTLTTGASEAVPKGPYADHMREKWAREGWFEYGKCPLTQIAGDQVKPVHFADEVLALPVTSRCPAATSDKPCDHALAEEARRKARQREITLKREAAWRSEAAKLAAEQQAANAAVIDSNIAVAAQLGALATAMSQQQPAPAPAPRTRGKKDDDE